MLIKDIFKKKKKNLTKQVDKSFPHIEIKKKYYKNTTLYFYTLASFFLLMIIWMVSFKIEIVSIAEGEVIPVGEVKSVQHLEGGIIEEILIKENEIVKKGQDLLILSGISKKAELEDLQVEIDSQKIDTIRLEAEINDFNKPIYPIDLVNRSNKLVIRSIKLFHSRKESFEGLVNEIDSLIKTNQINLEILHKQREMAKKLLDQGVLSEFSYLDVLKEFNKFKGESEELSGRKKRLKNEFIEKSRDELQNLQKELSQSFELMKKYKDNLDRSVIKAPITGIVKNLFFVTEGGVITPGVVILDIVPTNESLIIQAKLSSEDIGLIKPGLKSSIMLKASDAINFGKINAKVLEISPDIERGKNIDGNFFYNIILITEKNSFQSKNSTYNLSPGVQVIASIIIGERSIANYLFSPFISSVNGALQER